MNITDRVVALQLEGIEKRKIIAMLTLEDYTAAEIAKAFPPAEKRQTFRSEYEDYLVEETPSSEDAKEWIEDWIKTNPTRSSNIERHLKYYVNYAKLVQRVRAAVEG